MDARIKNLLPGIIMGFFYFAHGQSLNPQGSILGVHDPVMTKEGNTYYVFHTGNNIPVKTSSPTMTNWSNAGTAVGSASWHQQEVPGNNGRNFWAPDISYRDGQYWLYYSVSTFGSQSSAIGLVTSPTLANANWQNQGMVIKSTTYSVDDNAIDPNIIMEPNGNVWMNWGSWWDGIFLVQLDPQTGKPQSGAQAINIADRPGHTGIEGPFIIYARGYYHLFTSWDRCCAGTNSTYNMRYGRSTSVTGPYEDRSGQALTSGGGTLLDDGSQWAGGHNGVFEENGDFYLVYHIYTNQGNTLEIRHLYFDDEDWPTLDPNQALPISENPGGLRDRLPNAYQWPLSFNLPGPYYLTLHDISGKKVLEKEVRRLEARFPGLQRGTYYLTISSQEYHFAQRIALY